MDRCWMRSARLLGAMPRGGIEQIRRAQDAALRDLVCHAWRNVPYYERHLAGARVDPGRFRGAQDLATLPVSSKESFRSVPEIERLVRGAAPARLVSHLTGGSTGQPFRVYRTRSEELLLGFIRKRVEARLGVGARDLVADLTERAYRKPRMAPARALERLGFFRLENLDNSRPREEIAASIIALRPDVMTGYPSSLSKVAATFGATWRPRLVLVEGEMLTPDTRARIERGFGARVLETYGTNEFNLLAWECPHGTGLRHVCDDAVILEVLRDGRPAKEGESGTVVATALHSRAMPFLRFDTGDVAVRGPTPCECGWPSTTLRAIEGRVVEYFLLPGGRWLHPVSVVGPILQREIEWVDRHQLVQEDEDRIVLRIAPLRPPLREEVDDLETRARQILGDGVQFRIELTGDLTPEPGRKFRMFVSLSAPKDEAERSLWLRHRSRDDPSRRLARNNNSS